MNISRTEPDACFEFAVSAFPFLSLWFTPEQLDAIEAIVAVIGDSGVGKSSVVNSVFEKEERKASPRLLRLVETTTRDLREDEVDGIHMRNVDLVQFTQWVAQDRALYEQLRGNPSSVPRDARPHFLAAYWVWPEGKGEKLAGILFSDFIHVLSCITIRRQVAVLVTAAQVAANFKIAEPAFRLVVVDPPQPVHARYLAKRGTEPSGNRLGPGDLGFSFPDEVHIDNNPYQLGLTSKKFLNAVLYPPRAVSRHRKRKADG